MLYVKSESGEMVPITYSNAFAKCPKCGTMHQIDLADILACTGGDVEEATAYCEKCSAASFNMYLDSRISCPSVIFYQHGKGAGPQKGALYGQR